MLIHFPTAFFPAHWVFRALQFKYSIEALDYSAFYMLTGGMTLGWVALTFGTIDLATLLNQDKPPSIIRKALWHGGINFCVILYFSILWGISYKNFGAWPDPSIASLSLEALVLMAMLVGNYFGGSVILDQLPEDD